MIYRQENGEWKRISVNVGDWREKQEEYLSEMAKVTAERAKQTGEPQNLYNLSPSQRRIIHIALSEDKEIETESVGEGEERYLVVKPKK
jgi:spoIIIJ-associated protein